MDGCGAPTLPLPQDMWQDEGGHPIPRGVLWQSGVYSVFLSTLFIHFLPFSQKRLSENVESCVVIGAGILWHEPYGRNQGNLSQLMGRALGVCLVEARIPPLSLCLWGICPQKGWKKGRGI